MKSLASRHAPSTLRPVDGQWIWAGRAFRALFTWRRREFAVQPGEPRAERRLHISADTATA